MTAPAILGQLSGLHEMLRELVGGLPAAEAGARWHPELASPTWYLGRSVYRETYWLREVVAGDAELAGRVRHLFGPGSLDLDARCARMPPADHLLRWAEEIQDEHLRRLATPGGLPAHPLLAGDRLQWFLLQETARDYENLLMVLHARRLADRHLAYRVGVPLEPRRPEVTLVEVVQGHYRIGSRGDAWAYDNELPPQAVKLASFRIAQRPVTNAEYLGFMTSGGYSKVAWWDKAGQHWLAGSGAEAPLHWRRDADGHWFAVALNGSADLHAEVPVFGINRHEAAAFAAWAASLGGNLSGAALQHEYQWEVAARSGAIAELGQVWEWCANPFHPYPGFSPFPDATVSAALFGGGQASLRSAGLHTQRCLRRASLRNWAAPAARYVFAGIRLVFPPGSGPQEAHGQVHRLNILGEPTNRDLVDPGLGDGADAA